MPIGFFVARWVPRVAITPEPTLEAKQQAPLWCLLFLFVGLGADVFETGLIGLLKSTDRYNGFFVLSATDTRPCLIPFF